MAKITLLERCKRTIGYGTTANIGRYTLPIEATSAAIRRQETQHSNKPHLQIKIFQNDGSRITKLFANGIASVAGTAVAIETATYSGCGTDAILAIIIAIG